MVDPVLASKIQCPHHRGGVFRFRDQEADIRAGIDIFQHQRAHHDLAPRGGALQEKLGEVRLARAAHPGLVRELFQGETTEIAVFGFQAKIAADDGAHLGGVDAQMDARGAELQGLHFRAQGTELSRQSLPCPVQLAVEHGGDIGNIGDPVGVFGRENPRGIDQQFRLAEILGESKRLFASANRGARELFRKAAQRIGGRFGRKLGDAVAITVELHRLFRQAQGKALPPLDVGAAIQVIADPACKRRQGRAQRGEPVWEPRGGNLEDERGIAGHRRLGMGKHILGLGMLTLQRDRGGPIAAIGLQRGFQHAARFRARRLGLGGERATRLKGQREGGVGGQHDAAGGGFQLRRKGIPAGIGQLTQPGAQARIHLPGIAILVLGAEGLGALERLAEVNLVDQALGCLKIGLATLQAAEQGPRYGEDGIGLRILVDPLGIGLKLLSGRFQGLAGFGSSHVRSFRVSTATVLALSMRPAKAPASQTPEIACDSPARPRSRQPSLSLRIRNHAPCVKVAVIRLLRERGAKGTTRITTLFLYYFSSFSKSFQSPKNLNCALQLTVFAELSCSCLRTVTQQWHRRRVGSF